MNFKKYVKDELDTMKREVLLNLLEFYGLSRKTKSREKIENLFIYTNTVFVDDFILNVLKPELEEIDPDDTESVIELMEKCKELNEDTALYLEIDDDFFTDYINEKLEKNDDYEEDDEDEDSEYDYFDDTDDELDDLYI